MPLFRIFPILEGRENIPPFSWIRHGWAPLALPIYREIPHKLFKVSGRSKASFWGGDFEIFEIIELYFFDLCTQKFPMERRNSKIFQTDNLFFTHVQKFSIKCNFFAFCFHFKGTFSLKSFKIEVETLSFALFEKS